MKTPRIFSLCLAVTAILALSLGSAVAAPIDLIHFDFGGADIARDLVAAMGAMIPLNVRARGLMAAHANGNPNAILAELTTAFNSFKDKQHGEVRSLQTAVDELNASVAALKIGGGGGSEPGQTSGARAALRNLGEFGRTGNPDALTRGFQVNNAMSTDSSPDGGYLAPNELSAEIMRIQRNDSAMRRISRVIMTNSAAFKQPVSTGRMASGWVGEREARPETDAATLHLITVHSGEVYANPAVTQNLIDDSAYNLGEYIATEISEEFTAQEGSAFINGDGINKPRGFLTYEAVSDVDDSREFGKLQYVPTGVAAALSDSTHNGADALIDLTYALKAKHRRNANWLMNSKTAAIVRKFKTIGDTETYLWAQSIAAGQPNQLLGFPVEIDEDMPDIEADAFPIAFGDFQRGYIIADRTGVRILRDPFTAKPYVHFYSTKRVGGALLDSNAIKLLKVAAT